MGLADEFYALDSLGIISVAAAGNNYDGTDMEPGSKYFVIDGDGEHDYSVQNFGTPNFQGIGAPQLTRKSFL